MHKTKSTSAIMAARIKLTGMVIDKVVRSSP